MMKEIGNTPPIPNTEHETGDALVGSYLRDPETGAVAMIRNHVVNPLDNTSLYEVDWVDMGTADWSPEDIEDVTEQELQSFEIVNPDTVEPDDSDPYDDTFVESSAGLSQDFYRGKKGEISDKYISGKQAYDQIGKSEMLPLVGALLVDEDGQYWEVLHDTGSSLGYMLKNMQTGRKKEVPFQSAVRDFSYVEYRPIDRKTRKGLPKSGSLPKQLPSKVEESSAGIPTEFHSGYTGPKPQKSSPHPVIGDKYFTTVMNPREAIVSDIRADKVYVYDAHNPDYGAPFGIELERFKQVYEPAVNEADLGQFDTLHPWVLKLVEDLEEEWGEVSVSPTLPASEAYKSLQIKIEFKKIPAKIVLTGNMSVRTFDPDSRIKLSIRPDWTMDEKLDDDIQAVFMSAQIDDSPESIMAIRASFNSKPEAAAAWLEDNIQDLFPKLQQIVSPEKLDEEQTQPMDPWIAGIIEDLEQEGGKAKIYVKEARTSDWGGQAYSSIKQPSFIQARFGEIKINVVFKALDKEQRLVDSTAPMRIKIENDAPSGAPGGWGDLWGRKISKILEAASKQIDSPYYEHSYLMQDFKSASSAQAWIEDIVGLVFPLARQAAEEMAQIPKNANTDNMKAESFRMGGADAHIDPENGDSGQVQDLVPLMIDLGSSRRGDLDESFLRMFGSGIQAILGRMFGGPSIPVTVKGTKSEIDSFSNVLKKEKTYLESWSELGLDNPKTYKNKFKLDTAVRQFERKTGLKYPFK